MKRRVALGLLAAAVSPPVRVRAAGVVVRIGNVPIDSSSEIYAAQAQGFLARAGIEARVQPFTNGNAIAAGVVGGSLDIGSINVLSMAAAHARGVPLKFIDTGSIYTSADPTTVMLVPNDSPLHVSKDLAGKTVAVNVLKGIAHVSAQAWIDEHGGDSTAVKFIELPFSAMPAALQAARVDAAVVAEPFRTEAKNEARFFGKSYDGIADRWAIDGYAASDSWIAAHPDLARRFRDAMRQAAGWANRNQDKTAVLISKVMHVDVALVRSMHRATFLEHTDLSVVQPVIDVGARYGALKAPFPAADLFIAGALR